MFALGAYPFESAVTTYSGRCILYRRVALSRHEPSRRPLGSSHASIAAVLVVASPAGTVSVRLLTAFERTRVECKRCRTGSNRRPRRRRPQGAATGAGGGAGVNLQLN